MCRSAFMMFPLDAPIHRSDSTTGGHVPSVPFACQLEATSSVRCEQAYYRSDPRSRAIIAAHRFAQVLELAPTGLVPQVNRRSIGQQRGERGCRRSAAVTAPGAGRPADSTYGDGYNIGRYNASPSIYRLGHRPRRKRRWVRAAYAER